MMGKKRSGQAMIEYILIVGLIAIALIGIFSFFGKKVHAKVKGAAEAISTESASDTYDENKIKSLGEN